MRTLIALAVAGAIGAIARYGVEGWVSDRTGGGFPWGTHVVNVMLELARLATGPTNSSGLQALPNQIPSRFGSSTRSRVNGNSGSMTNLR